MKRMCYDSLHLRFLAFYLPSCSDSPLERQRSPSSTTSEEPAPSGLPYCSIDDLLALTDDINIMKRLSYNAIKKY